LPLYAINLGVVSLFTDLSFTFLAMFVFDCGVLYQFEECFIFVKKTIVKYCVAQKIVKVNPRVPSIIIL